MTQPTTRNQLAVFFLLFGIQQTCLAPWAWPFFGRTRTSADPRIENVIFDLGGVLMQTNNKKAVSSIGLSKLVFYTLTFHNPKKINAKLYSTLDLVMPLDPTGPLALTPDGSRLLPQLMRAWLTGTLTCAECRKLAVTFIDQHPETFDNTTEQSILRAAATMTFSPQALVTIQQVDPQGIEFVKQCKERGFNVYILSNLDAESYDLVRQANPELFNLFDEKNIFVSGKMGLMKPDPAIYELLLAEAGLDADTCVFFDDQQENVAAARSCGINAFQCRTSHGHPDYALLEKQLDNLILTQARLATTHSTAHA